VEGSELFATNGHRIPPTTILLGGSILPLTGGGFNAEGGVLPYP